MIMTLDVIKGRNFELTPESITIFTWQTLRTVQGWVTKVPPEESEMVQFNYPTLVLQVQRKLHERVREGVFMKVAKIVLNPPAALYLATENVITVDNFRQAATLERSRPTGSSGYFDLPQDVRFGEYAFPVRVARWPRVNYAMVMAITADARGFPVGMMTGALAVAP